MYKNKFKKLNKFKFKFKFKRLCKSKYKRLCMLIGEHM